MRVVIRTIMRHSYSRSYANGKFSKSSFESEDGRCGWGRAACGSRGAFGTPGWMRPTTRTIRSAVGAMRPIYLEPARAKAEPDYMD